MKKIALLLSVLTALTAVFAAIPASAVEIPPEALFFGDADLDGSVHANDARLILRHAAKLELLSSQTAQILADMDANGKINATDARLALRAAGRIDPLRKGESPGASTDPTAANEPTTLPPTETPPTETPPITTPPITQAPTAEQTQNGPTTAAPSDPAQNAELLAEFGEVMRATKAQVKGFSLKEWDELTELELGSIASLFGGTVREFLDDKLRAEDSAEEIRSADTELLPPYGALPDAGSILSAEKRDNGDGTETITLVLKDETNPAPYDKVTGRSSATGRLFPVEDSSEAEAMVLVYAAQIPYASAELTGLTYSGCTISCTYDAAAGRAVSLSRRTPVRADVEMRAVVLKINAHAAVTVCSEFGGFRY